MQYGWRVSVVRGIAGTRLGVGKGENVGGNVVEC